jgi:MFS family permease
VSLVFGVIFAFFLSQTVIQIAMPIAASSAGISGAGIGVLIAIPSAVGLLFDIPLGALSDSIGRKGPILAGAMVGAVAGVVLAMSRDALGYSSGMALSAIAISLIQFPSLAYITEATPRIRHALVQGYNGTVQRLSLTAGTIVVGAALGRQDGAWTAFILAAAASAMAVPLVAGVSEAPRTSRAKKTNSPSLLSSYHLATRLLTTRPMMLLAAQIALANGLVVLVIGNSFIPLYLVREMHEPPLLAALLLTSRNVVAALLSSTFGPTSARFGIRRLILATNSLAAISVLLVPFAGSTLLLLLALVLQGIGYAFSAGTANVLIAAATIPSERAVGFAANQFVARLGVLVLSPILGWLLDSEGAPSVFYVGAAFALANVVWMLATSVAVHREQSSLPL